MNYFCNKCGYAGLVQVGHPMNALSGMPCPYYAVPLPDLTEAERQKIEKDFGLSRVKPLDEPKV